MAAPTWFDFIKPRLASMTMQAATIEYFKRYFPELHAEAKLIADEAIARASRLAVPEECSMPADIPIGVQIVSAFFEERTLR